MTQTQPPTQANDTPARQRALALDHSFIIQAPAGSGKTGLLVRRILKLLSVVQKPEAILAITFTRKATAEMRERVIDSLRRADQHAPFEDYELDLAQFAQLALARNRELGWNLLQQPQRLRIQTIDALCTDLIRQMPWSTRFGAMPQIENDIRSLCEQAAMRSLKKIDQTQSPLAPAISTLLIELGGDLNKLKRDLAELLLDRNRWLTLLMSEKGQLQNRQQLEAHWQRRVEWQLKACGDLIGTGLRDRIVRLGRYAANELPEKAQHLPVNELKTATRFPQAQIAALSIWLGIADLLLTQKGGWRKSVNVNNGFARNVPEKDEMTALLAELAEDEPLRNQLHQLRQLPEAKFHDGQWALLDALITLLPDAASELYLLFSETGQSDFSELTYRAIAALGDEQQPTDLALIQDYRTQHILMDEFQDTSPQQLELLQRLTSGWEPEDGRSLFLVGDPMQSIYRFREADVRVFLQVCDQGVGNIQPEFLQLSANFRSAATVVNWVNQVFPEVLPQQSDREMGAVSYTAADAIHADLPGEVQFHPLIDAERSDEAVAVVAFIQAQQAKHPGEEIAVLGRTRTHLTPIAEALRAAQIPFESIELESLNDQPVVQDLISLTRALLHPYDRIAWLSLLRAPWCGLNLADLLLFSEAKLAIEEAIITAEIIEAASADGQLRLRRLTGQLTPILTQRGKGSLAKLTRDTWSSLNGAACIEASQLEHAEAYFTLLEQLEQKPAPLNLSRLQQSVKQQRVSSPPQTVKLLTMHKAKGLEFETVILTGLDGQSAGSRTRVLLRWERFDKTLLIAPIMPIGMTDNRHDAYLKQIEASRDTYEAGRLLYVATTRARRNLHLFARINTDKNGDFRPPIKSSLLSLIWEQTLSQWQNAPSHTLTTAQHTNQSIGLLQRLPIDYTPPSPPVPITAPSRPQTTGDIEYDWARELARIIGTVTHQYLEHADTEQLQTWRSSVDLDALKQRLTHAGITSAEEIDTAINRIEQILSKLATDSRAQWLFSVQHQAIEKEWALTGVHQGAIRHVVLDRSFVDKQGTRWIVDFKTGHHEGGDAEQFLNEEKARYEDQLDRYAHIVNALEPGQSIRCGLYFPAMRAWREWSPALGS